MDASTRLGSGELLTVLLDSATPDGLVVLDVAPTEVVRIASAASG